MTAFNPIEVVENKEFSFNIVLDLENIIKEKYNKFIEVKDSFQFNDKEVKLFCKAKDYIGFIALPNKQTLYIKPKFKRAKFLEMLIRSQSDYILLLKPLIEAIDPSDFFNFFEKLINNFLNEAKNLQLRKVYVPKTQITRKLRGRLLLYKSFQREDILSGNFVCEFDDFNYDSIENRIIKYTLSEISYFSNPFQKRLIKSLLIRYKRVSFKKIISSDFKKLKYNRLNIHYKPVHFYCRLFIEKFIFGSLSGKKEIHSFLINSWDIYERFLRQILKDNLNEFDVSKETFYDKNRNKFEIDILIRKNKLKEKRIYLIADAKYKIDYDRENDVGQMLRYLRFFTNQTIWNFPINHRFALLIYPKKSDGNIPNSDENFKDYDNGHLIGNIQFIRIDLEKIDDEEYIQNWIGRIKSKYLTI